MQTMVLGSFIANLYNEVKKADALQLTAQDIAARYPTDDALETIADIATHSPINMQRAFIRALQANQTLTIADVLNLPTTLPIKMDQDTRLR